MEQGYYWWELEELPLEQEEEMKELESERKLRSGMGVRYSTEAAGRWDGRVMRSRRRKTAQCRWRWRLIVRRWMLLMMVIECRWTMLR